MGKSKVTKKTPRSIAKAKGRMAFNQGKYMADNPYDKQTQYNLYQAWILGYDEADKAKQARYRKDDRAMKRGKWGKN